MRLHVKAFVLFAMVGFTSLIILLMSSYSILLSSYSNLETQTTSKNVERVLSAIDSDLESLDAYTHDWASWDDTYLFVQDRNENYIHANLVDQTFVNVKLNLIMFVDTSGRTVFSKAFDLQNMTETQIPPDLQNLTGEESVLWQNLNESSSLKGFILLPEGPMMVVSRPILTSNAKGPIRGALVMGRYFDSTQVARISNETHLTLSMERLDDPNLPADFQAALARMSGYSSIVVEPLNASIVAGYGIIRDLNMHPILMLKIDLIRSIYSQGLATINLYLFSVCGLSIILGTVGIVLINKSILAPLSKLSTNVTNIAKKGEISARVAVKGDNEVSDLATSINKMLASLEHSESELKKSTKKLEQARLERLAAVGQAAAMVGHDLRNPLTSITGASYFLKQNFGKNLDGRSNEALEIIDKGVRYSNEIISDLLDYSREIKVEYEETTPRLIVQETLAGIEVPSNVKVDNLAQNAPKIFVDTGKMRRVFSNIVKNAIEVMPQGGTLAINSRVEQENVEVTFADTGLGIPLEVMGKLWTPFFTTKSKGLGLGLAICKRIVETHGGKILVESTVGKGTTFRITLPIRGRMKEEKTALLLIPLAQMVRSAK